MNHAESKAGDADTGPAAGRDEQGHQEGHGGLRHRGLHGPWPVRMGMSRQAISRRMNDGGWKDEELWKLVRVLKLSAEQLAAMLGALPWPAA